MRNYRADIHIHTVLSPCGDFGMTPGNIIEKAGQKGLDIIGISDHNTTRHCALAQKMAKDSGIFVLNGVEINTREEVHCLAFFENLEKLEYFQEYIDNYLMVFPHNHEKMGDQVQIDENEMIVYREDRFLGASLTKSVNEIEREVHSLEGIFIPAHINRPGNSIYSQLGFIPDDLDCDAVEIRPDMRNDGRVEAFLENAKQKYAYVHSSDAHYLENIGQRISLFRIEKPGFNEIKLALHSLKGREVIAI